MKAVKRTGADYSRWVDHRARKIDDPVAKLRYLRGEFGSVLPDEIETPTHHWRLLGPAALVAVMLLPLPTVSTGIQSSAPAVPSAHIPPLSPPPETALTEAPPSVWLVEDAPGYETYSNGLRVETRYSVGFEKRLYPVYDPQTLELIRWQSGPAGIVYHTTESHQAPFEPSQNGRLRRVGKWLLEFVQRKHAYHYVIDRFGRVNRVVRDTDVANHAGYSIWADSERVYVNLNHSFIGVSFETETKESAQGASINEAQVHAAKVLTEMLRSRYGIPGENCITHAQVSVASRSMKFGNHMDWAANFPFDELGLGNNYARPVAAVSIFGFDYGADLLKATGTELWKGIAYGENTLRQRAALENMTIARYRKDRKKRYREILKVIEETVLSREKGS